MLEAGVDPEIRDVNGETALELAIDKGKRTN